MQDENAVRMVFVDQGKWRVGDRMIAGSGDGSRFSHERLTAQQIQGFLNSGLDERRIGRAFIGDLHQSIKKFVARYVGPLKLLFSWRHIERRVLLPVS